MSDPRRTLKLMKPATVGIVLVLLCAAATVSVVAQAPGAAGRTPTQGATSVVVLVPRADPGDTAGELLAETVADALELSLRLTGRYETEPPPTRRTAPTDQQGFAALAASRNLDFVIFGEIRRGGTGRGAGETSVTLGAWDHRARSVTFLREASFPAGTDGRDLAAGVDRLAVSLLTGITGQPFVWGAVELVNQAERPGEHLVYVDGVPAGRNRSVLARVPVGERVIEVVALEGEFVREVIVSRRVNVGAGVPRQVVFSLGTDQEGRAVATAPPPVEDTVADTAEPVATREQPDDSGPPPTGDDAVGEQDRSQDQDQDQRGPGTFLGFRIGYGFAWLGGAGYRDATGDDRWDSPVDDIAAGLLLEQGVTERFALELDLAVQTRGGRTIVRDSPVVDGSITYIVTARSLSLGLYLKSRTVGEGRTVHLLLGPQLVWLQETPTVKVETDDSSFSFDLDPDQEFMVGVAGGFGVDVPVGRAVLFGDLRYTRTLTSFFDQDDWFFNAVVAGAGVRFRL